ncbi:MAG: DNA adenine methylase [Panacagrimonas sp.]
MATTLKAPFPWFGGKRDVSDAVWSRFGRVKHYIEPFCGSSAMLLSAPSPANLEVVNDVNGFIANFWRAVKNQPENVAIEADYPVSHIDQGARHVWLMSQRQRVGDELQDATWPGDARVAGWWLWGQCCWIGSGWCEWFGKEPHVGNAGMGVQALGQVPHVSDAGMGVQALGKVPHVSNAGRGDLITSAGRASWSWLRKLSDRLERVRVIHGDWSRCLNTHYGGTSTAVFLDPPYRSFDAPYGAEPVADAVEAWARDNGDLRVAICGHVGDYDLPGWECEPWKRKRLTYGSAKTTDQEAIWFSPACLGRSQVDLFGGAA